MKLKIYIIEVLKIEPKEARRQLNALGMTKRPISRQRFINWFNGVARPQGDEEVAAIVVWSHGHVTANDFYNIPEIPSASSGGTPDGLPKMDRFSSVNQVAGAAHEAVAGHLVTYPARAQS